MSLILPIIGAFGHSAAAGAAPTFHAISTAVSSTLTADLSWPTGHAANDIGIIFTITRDNDTPGTPTDWTELLAANDGNKKVNIYWKRAASGAESNVTVPDPGQYVWAQMMTIRGCVTGSTPVALLASDTLGTTSTSFTVPTGTTTGANRLVLTYCSSNEDEQYSSRLSTGFTNSNLSGLTNRMEDHTGTGEGGGHYAATGTLASAGATGTTTGTFAAACTQCRAVFEFIGA